MQETKGLGGIHGGMKLTNEYESNYKKGNKYQDFIVDLFIETFGIAISCYSSKENQYNKGESRQGIEIKFDDILKETGNLYIEIKEKANENNDSYVDSGIFRNDNTWLYVIGDYEDIFIFSKKMLQQLYKHKSYEQKTIATSKGYLLPKEEAGKYCITYIKGGVNVSNNKK